MVSTIRYPISLFSCRPLERITKMRESSFIHGISRTESSPLFFYLIAGGGDSLMCARWAPCQLSREIIWEAQLITSNNLEKKLGLDWTTSPWSTCFGLFMVSNSWKASKKASKKTIIWMSILFTKLISTEYILCIRHCSSSRCVCVCVCTYFTDGDEIKWGI